MAKNNNRNENKGKEKMASLNKVFLLGRLTRDVENRHTQSGKAVCDFGLAVSRKFTDANGQQQEETCFVDIAAWGKTAEICEKFLSKGSQVMIEGRLQLDQWEDRNSGEKRSKLKVIAENVQFTGSKNDGDGSRNDNGNQGGYQQQSMGVDPNYAPPQREHYQAKANGYQPDNGIGEDSDDIPF